MKISQIKKQAKGTLKGNWGLSVLLTFVVMLLDFLLPSIVKFALGGGASSLSNPDNTSVSGEIFQIIYTILLMPFLISVIWFYLNLVRGTKPEIPQVFSIYKDGGTSLKLIGAALLQMIYTFLWTLLLIIPGIIKGLSYSQTYYL